MQNQGNDSTMKILVGVVLVAVVAIVAYMTMNGNSASDTKEKVTATPVKSADADKAGFTAAQKKEIEEVVIKLVREQSDTFMAAINDGMQLQQEKVAQDLIKTATAEKDNISKNAVIWGDPKAAMRVYAMIDPMCPHCHDFMRVAITVLEKSKDVSFQMIVAPILGANSVAVSKVILASHIQGADKSKKLMAKFVDNVTGLDRAKFIGLIKDAGIDVARFEKDEASDAIEKQLLANVGILEKLKVPGVPTIFIENKDGTLISTPPMKPEDFVELAERLKDGEDISKPSTKPKKEETKKEEAKKPEVKVEAKPEAKADVKKEEAKKPEAKADAKADVKKEEAKKPEAKAEAKSEAKADVKKEETKKPEAKAEAKPEAKADVKKEEAKKSEVKVEAKSEAKADVKKEEAKADAKPDVKTDADKKKAH